MKTHTAHTKTPWEANGSRITIGGEMRAWQLIVAIFPTTVDPRPTADAACKSIEERDEVIARIVALHNSCEGIGDPGAAPELLAALKHATARLEAMTEAFRKCRADGLPDCQEKTFADTWLKDDHGVAEFCRAAIARATGEKGGK